METNHKMENDELIYKALERYDESISSDMDERLLYQEDVSFAINDDGCQWPVETRRMRETDSPPRPCLVINKIPEKIDQVEGEFRQLNPSVKVRPVDSYSDPIIADIIGGMIRHIQYDSSARSAYTHAHTHTLYGGRGAWTIDIEDDRVDPFTRVIKINRVMDALSVSWDPSAEKEDKSDANYFFITKEINIDVFKSEYGDIDIGDWPLSGNVTDGWRTDDTIRVCKYWWKEPVDRKFYRVFGKDGMTRTISEDDLEKLPIDVDILEEKTVKSKRVRYGTMIHNQFIDGPNDDWPIDRIPVVIEMGKEVNIGGQTKSRGMTRFAIGPQQMYNFWSTSTTEMTALAPKSPYLATPKMIGKYQSQWDSAAYKNYMYLLYDGDPSVPGGKPTREHPPQLSSGYASELGRMEHDIMSAMGIYQASLGDEGSEKSGRAILAKQKQGSIGSYTFTDKFKNALIYSTKIVMELIPFVYDTERIIRITGEDGSEKSVPINAVPNGPAMRAIGDEVSDDMISVKPEISQYINDLTVGRYDLVVTIGPSYDTQRTEAAAIMMDLVEIIPQIGLATADILVKSLDLPGSNELVKRIKKMIPVGLRDKEPGEAEEVAKPPDPEIMIKIHEQQRKDFEAITRAIKDLAEAESKEKGSQLAQFTAIANEIKNMVANTTGTGEITPR